MKLENTAIYNMMAAIKAARLSYGSESDSPKHEGEDAVHNDDWHYPFAIGPKDTELIKKLVAGGSSHRKFMRAILLTVDITAPRYCKPASLQGKPVGSLGRRSLTPTRSGLRQYRRARCTPS